MWVCGTTGVNSWRVTETRVGQSEADKSSQGQSVRKGRERRIKVRAGSQPGRTRMMKCRCHFPTGGKRWLMSDE
jgi:hypothetical protein